MGIDPGTNYMGYGVVEVTGRELRSVVMGAIDLHKLTDPYAKLRRIFDRVGALVDEYAPREVALESPFFGENVQSMLKLGRAQGVAMEGRQPKSRWRHWSPAYWGSTTPPRSSTRPTAWPWRCAITSCRAARSTPHWATNATRGWAAAARPRRRTAANRGKNSSKRTPTANPNRFASTNPPLPTDTFSGSRPAAAPSFGAFPPPIRHFNYIPKFPDEIQLRIAILSNKFQSLCHQFKKTQKKFLTLRGGVMKKYLSLSTTYTIHISS